MVSVPYLSLGIVGFMIYRGCKKNEAFRQARRQPANPTSDDAANPA